MDIFADILELLTILENKLQCPTCGEKCLEPVRIKTCGHYFCSECLKCSKENHNCPKCNEFYELKHLDYENIAKVSEKQLVELRKLLESPESTDKVPKRARRLSENLHNTVRVANDNIILYNNNKYHVNFSNMENKPNSKGESPLHVACKRKKLDVVKKLVESKVDINAKDYAGWAPLHEAVQSQSLEIVGYLLEKHCLVNIPGVDYVTPLHQAASLNNIGIVKLLLKYGALHMVDYTGLKPKDCTTSQAIKDVLDGCDNAYYLKNRLFEVFLPGKVSLYCHSIDDHIKKKLEDSKNIQVVEKMEFKKSLTHFMVQKTHKLSFKIMQAMLEGLQFLTEDSVDNYTKGNYFVNIPEQVFLANNAELNEGIRKAMLSALLKFPRLFDGINFYIEDHISPVDVYQLKVDKEYLANLIKAGGGRVLNRPPATRTCESEYAHPFFAPLGSGTYQCCNFIIFAENKPPDLMYKMKELQHKSSKWLIDCVIQYEIID